MKFIALFIFLFSSSFSYAIKESDLFPASVEDYREASVWYNSFNELCLIYGCNIIVIDKWHYPNIEDDDD